MQKIIRIFLAWLPLAVVSVALGGLAYGLVQQDYRHLADDPQIQMAEDGAALRASGSQPEALLPAAQVDVASSLAPFVIVYDESGKVLAASGLLRGQVPALPDGVLAYTRQHGQDRVSWQPEPGVRIAAVIAAVQAPGSGFVLAGRSLREVEVREDQAMQITTIGVLAALAAAFLFTAASELLRPGPQKAA